MTIKVNPEAAEKIKNYRVDDSDLRFGKYMCPVMVVCEFKDGNWGEVEMVPYQNLAMDPCTKVLHYGQEIFEGIKAYKTSDNKVLLFRPDMNASRFNRSAKRMCMPEFSEKLFIESCETIAAYSKHVIPKRLGESLYIRPFMIATEVSLGIRPATQFHFLAVASPSGSYFSGSTVKVLIERKDSRACRGGTGAAKTGGNYSASLQSYKKSIDFGCDQTMWLDADEKTYIEEMSGMNFFCMINGEFHTPELTDTILDGITRDSLITLAKNEGFKVVERKINVNELMEQVKTGECTEAFVCGTASILAPISSFHEENGESYEFKDMSCPNGMKLRELLLNIQCGRAEGPQGWNHWVDTVK